MEQSWPKIILDPVHRIIPFLDTREDRLLLGLINSREFQRLRRIKQLGMSETVFPGSNHSRFAHSIGVMHTARMMFDRLQFTSGDKYPLRDRAALLAAALLHDIGHGPFSHAFEKVTGEDHEKRTEEIILAESTEVSGLLREYESGLPERLGRLFGERTSSPPADSLPPELAAIVSSQLDADRFDYLLRDSHATGTNYGDFDLHWLIHHLFVDAEKGRLYLSRKALLTAEAYVFARHHMYSTVYFHKTTRAAETMLQLLFRRYKELIGAAGADQEGAASVVPSAPDIVVSAFAGRLSLDDYLALDDFAVTEFFKACALAPDQVLSSLGRGLVERKLYKGIDASDASPVDVADFQTKATKAVERRGLDANYALVRDNAEDVPYKPYDPDDKKPATQIYVEDSTGQVVELGKVSSAVDELKKRYTLLRYYFPNELRDDLGEIAAKTILKKRPSSSRARRSTATRGRKS